MPLVIGSLPGKCRPLLATVIAWTCWLLPAFSAGDQPLHPAVGQKLIPADVDWQHPIYQSSFADPARLKDWRLEGGKKMSVAGGKLVLESTDEGSPADNKDHLVCWLTKEIPADFLLESSVRPRSRRDGLNIVFFNARGLRGENVFDPGLAPRNGLFQQYHSGDLKNYHISYWASTLENGPRNDANLRKNPGFHLVAVGKDLVTPAPADSFQTIRLYKRGGVIRLMVDDVVSVAYDDDGQTNGPIWSHSGWIGLRQMGRTVRCEYEDLKVYALKTADSAKATLIAWPPQHMQALPADYLERARASLMAGKGRLARLHFNNTKSADSIGWARYGLPALILGERVDEINQFFESDKFVWSANPKFGFSLFGTSFMRVYGLMNQRTGPMAGPLSPKALENFEREMWRVAKANSKLAEARRDVWDMEGSENHHLSSKSCDFLAAQYLRNIPAYAQQKYDDGSTLAEQYEARRAYFLRWFDERAKRGQFVEAGSPSYQGDSISALFNLRDFAEDPVLRRKAEMYLDLAYAVIAEETLLTIRGGPKSRVKVGHEYDGGMSDRGYDVLFGAPGRTYVPLGVGAHSTSNYYPPPAIVNLAKDTSGRGTYRFATRWPGPVAEGRGKNAGDPDGILWRTLDPERSVLRNGFATPSYVIGSAGLDPAWLDDASMGFRWQGVVFSGDPLARIGFDVKPANQQDWHGFNPFFSVQDRNVLVTQKWAPVPPNPPSGLPAYLRVYFSPTLDEVQEAGGWIFAKDGNAFAAVKVVAGGYTWTPAWKHAADVRGDKPCITLQAENSPVILIANQASDYQGDFAAFQAAVQAQPLHYANGVLNFATITFYGPAKQGQVNGQTVNLAPARGYDSAFIRSDWNSGLIYIRKADDTVILDFRDPNNPVKTIGAPLTSAFPPGVGAETPIIFGKAGG
jgi:Domain of unknown function (DUF1961)